MYKYLCISVLVIAVSTLGHYYIYTFATLRHRRPMQILSKKQTPKMMRHLHLTACLN